ncbi:MAG TPA: KamA family radical SAM protein [Myxococcota bacterium]|nr:KamA family radical SAM protein [Myxococcota bacterium]HNZ02954.1 KamA family radical SAM protein [Myxococcota bacterium]HPB49988.1 KamA family radical SAM protein [Myxococcota bacterium]HQP95010.1 KamA family radical SAM protein [Myxococcota bacterium]
MTSKHHNGMRESATEFADRWDAGRFFNEASEWLALFASPGDSETIRRRILDRVNLKHFETYSSTDDMHDLDRVVVRDCARAWRGILHPRSESLAGFSVLQALIDASAGLDRPDLTDGFWAEICHLVRGIEGKVRLHGSDALPASASLTGREAATVRSDELDRLADQMNAAMGRFAGGLDPVMIERRGIAAGRIASELGAGPEEFLNWRWQMRHLATNETTLAAMASLSASEIKRISRAREHRIPMAVTPYYASLFDDRTTGGRDAALRAQVIPPESYIDAFKADGVGCGPSDYMLESDTSPVDLVTRRYAAIAIMKPWNSCPQICVYCQRNWEIGQPLSEQAIVGSDRVKAALDWLGDHPGLQEVLVTGGDPLMMTDSAIKRILDRIAAMPHVERIRIGTRTPLTMPMRITPELATLLGSYRVPGVREICVVTHAQHPTEITPDFVKAIDLLRRQGIPVYNQLVYTFFVSRRFEAAALRRLLRRCGVDPYYTFYPKGKQETVDYRVPIARILQEQKEEARLLPGLARTDEAVYNVPGLGKNYLNSPQHRDLISVRPNGARVYEFHPWEKKIAPSRTWVGEDVPILDYLKRLNAVGEKPSDYSSIWYYF